MSTLTSQQQAAAYAPTSVAVLAGAGSGKTHMLVARYLYLLRTYSPLQIVAVTFTEAGAAQLKARVRQAVHQERPGDIETLAELEAAQISTIHALCGRIVRDHPTAAGVRPETVIMDESQTRIWNAQHLPLATGQLSAELFTHLTFTQMLQTLEFLLSDPLLARQSLQIGSDDWGLWTEQAQERALSELMQGAEWKQALKDLRTHQGSSQDLIEQNRQAALSAVAALSQPETRSSGLQTLQAIKLTGGSVKYWSEGGLDVVKAALKVLRESALTVEDGVLGHTPGEADDWLKAALPDLRKAFTQIWETLSSWKRRAGLMDFNDLEVHALQALQHPEVRNYYAQRWQAYLIDEAQDTNPVQAEIFELLSGQAQRTLVGDLKQSIYGFRRAAPELFQKTSETIAAQGGQQVELNLSFRTHQELVKDTNAIFATLLQELHAPLKGVRPGPTGSLEAWYLDGIKPKARARKAEASLIAQQLQAKLLEGFPIHDTATGRGLKPGDIAILTRSWAALVPIRQALVAIGLPVQDMNSGSLLETQEARDNLALLTALAFHDPTALVTVLRSPFLTVRDAVIHELGHAAQQQGWFTALATSNHPELAPARELFSVLTQLQHATLPSELLIRADLITGYSAVIANLWETERRLADWQGFIEFVRDLEKGEDDVFSVVRRLQEAAEQGSLVPRPILEERDAITLTTMHSSKGLEWPLVVAADLNWSTPPGIAQVLMDGQLGVSLRGPFEEPPALHLLIAEKQQQRDLAETKRLLYVALTRARDHLIMTANGGPQGKSLLALLAPALVAANIPLKELASPLLSEDLEKLPILLSPPLPQQFILNKVQII